MGKLQEQYPVQVIQSELTIPQRRRRKKWRLVLFITWLLLLALYIQSFFEIGAPLLPSAMALKILVRSAIIILTWYFLISPVLKKLLHKWLQQKKQQSAGQVQQVFGNLFNLDEEFKRDGSQFSRLLMDGEVLQLGRFNISAMHTPGHTPACMTYLIDDGQSLHAFLGDTPFLPDSRTCARSLPGRRRLALEVPDLVGAEAAVGQWGGGYGWGGEARATLV